MIFFEKRVVQGRELSVCLPPSYGTAPERSYPVVYVQDGGELVAHTYNRLQHLVRMGKLQEAVYVGVAPHNRNDEYTPWPAEALLEGRPPFGGGARAYVDELADVCKVHIDAAYRTKPEPEHTAVVGGSFGGLVSLFAGLWRPDVFGRLGLLSASFWYEGVLPYLERHEPPAGGQRIYMSVGDCEGIYKRNRQRDMVEATRAAHRLWRERGVTEDRLRFSLDPGGTHDAHDMAGHFPKAMQWLFPPPESPAATFPVFARWTSGYEVPRTEHRILRSERSGREYRIFLAVPTAPPPDNGYPVLYTLDANATFGSIAEAVRLQGRKPHGIAPQVVVGIGYDAEGPIATPERFFDYTDEAGADELPPRPDGSEWPATGGAEAFAAFIEEELKPCVESLLPIDRSRQALFGHSLGGYFALRMLLLRPGAFRTYVAGSPSIWWKNRVLYDWLPAFAERVKNGDAEASLLIGVEMDQGKMQADAEELCRRLEPCAGARFRLSLRRYEGEGHVSMIYPLISDMLRFL